MFSATRYEVTKLYRTGYLAGLELTSTTGVEMPVGAYTECVTGDVYDVTACRLVIDYLGRSVTA
jgi:hypothetical protein